MTEGEKKQSKKGDLLTEACAAYGIAPEFVLSSRLDPDTGEIVIVTNGGSRVRFTSGQKVEPLNPVAVTGINPVKRKSITGDKKKSKV